MVDDLTPLSNSDHWLGWLGDNPVAAVRNEVEGMLQQQVSTARLEWIRVLDTPYYLTGGRKQADDPNHLVVTRAALAVPFELEVQATDGVERLTGVFSWVATHLDAERSDRVYLDLEPDLWRSEELKIRTHARLYEVEDVEEAPATQVPWWQFWRRRL